MNTALSLSHSLLSIPKVSTSVLSIENGGNDVLDLRGDVFRGGDLQLFLSFSLLPLGLLEQGEHVLEHNESDELAAELFCAFVGVLGEVYLYFQNK